MVVAVLHPGAMGIAIATSVQRSGATVRCCLDGRSKETVVRAESASLEVHNTLASTITGADVVLSVCPPHASLDVAREVADLGYTGIYADCNAISPERTTAVAGIMSDATFVDGGIVGGPPKERNSTYLYLSGPTDATGQVAGLFSEGLIESSIISEQIGDASAMKMCYAAYTKGSTALLLAIVGAAEELGVRDTLFEQWKNEGSELDTAAERRARFVTKKAWRWIDEMEEIANTLEAVGAPDGFHRAAADVYRRIEHLRPTSEELPPMDDVIDALRKSRG